MTFLDFPCKNIDFNRDMTTQPDVWSIFFFHTTNLYNKKLSWVIFRVDLNQCRKYWLVATHRCDYQNTGISTDTRWKWWFSLEMTSNHNGLCFRHWFRSTRKLTPENLLLYKLFLWKKKVDQASGWIVRTQLKS